VIRGISLSIHNTSDGTTIEKAFSRLPVRIGRNSLNDVCLPLNFVSQFHAVIELHEEQLLLLDLGSTNGTMLRNKVNVPPNGYFPLAECNYEFLILPFVIRVAPVEVDPGAAARRSHPPADEDVTGIMVPGVSSAVPEEFASLYQSFRGGWAALHDVITKSLARTHGPEREALLLSLARTYPALLHEPEFRALSAQSQDQNRAETRLAAAALAHLRALAARYLPPHQQIHSEEDVASFVLEVQATLDLLFRCFLPLRDGHKQFETQMKLEKGSRSWAGPQGPSVETATTVAELGSVLLDWRREDQAGDAVEGIFADIMIHQVALLNGVMEGVKTLLAELRPEAIEALADKKQRGNIGIGPFRYKQLWEAYAERHQDLAEEERFAFELIFGPRFAAAYRRFHNAASLPAGTLPGGVMRVGGGPVRPDDKE
jgi:type VI secretion system protein ImpI